MTQLVDFTVTSDKEDSRWSLTWQVLRPPVDPARKKILRCKFPSIGQQWICARLLTIDWVAWFGFVGLKQTRGLVKHQAIKINLDNLAETIEPDIPLQSFLLHTPTKHQNGAIYHMKVAQPFQKQYTLHTKPAEHCSMTNKSILRKSSEEQNFFFILQLWRLSTELSRSIDESS